MNVESERKRREGKRWMWRQNDTLEQRTRKEGVERGRERKYKRVGK